MDMTNTRREVRYGMPAADQIIFNRHYLVGYSYYFRQAKWALEVVSKAPPIDTSAKRITRSNSFRTDYRIPEMFQTTLTDYSGSNYDRGHLVASANQQNTKIQNSETFLLSNMSPQNREFNRGIWKTLEANIRDLNAQQNILETYVICGPIFYFDRAVEDIDNDARNSVTLPIPHAYFKSILTENHRGKLKMWSFILPNTAIDKLTPPSQFQVSTTTVERLAGIKLWSTLVGPKIAREKNKTRAMW